MALIICPECRKEFSDKASACPNCGCPTEEILAPAEKYDTADDILVSNDESTTDKILGMVQDGVASIIEANKNAIRPTKKVGPVQIDEVHHKFRINGSVPVNGKKMVSANLCSRG